ncbi:hypothetical protein AwErysi_09610 [Erysipelotrichaceae bacterium]|nr:hypothetical protein AwErysi_09610 [Erysipelotrichaceae bacterium]
MGSKQKGKYYNWQKWISKVLYLLLVSQQLQILFQIKIDTMEMQISPHYWYKMRQVNYTDGDTMRINNKIVGQLNLTKSLEITKEDFEDKNSK